MNIERVYAASPKTIRLSASTSVARYQLLEADQDREAISEFLKERFTERYIRSLSNAADRKNGFAMMALSCLMIESLESFHRGWSTTKLTGPETFGSFFSRYSVFSAFAAVSGDFYKNIRCGILHQGETKGGWRVRRDGPLFQEDTLTINATKFLRAVETALQQYCERLATEPWDSDLWRLCRKKLQSVCRNAVGVRKVLPGRAERNSSSGDQAALGMAIGAATLKRSV